MPRASTTRATRRHSRGRSPHLVASSSSSSANSPPPASRQQDRGEPTIPPDFHDKVYAIVRRIPEGRVTSYGSIAKQLGHPRHSRLVGQALKHLSPQLASPHLRQRRRRGNGGINHEEGDEQLQDNHYDNNDNVDDEDDDNDDNDDNDEEGEVLPEPDLNPDWVPWHRVVASSGVISPRAGSGPRTQAQWLEAEGVEVMQGPRAGAGGGGGGADDGGGPPAGVDAFGLGAAGTAGGRVSMARYGWNGED